MSVDRAKVDRAPRRGSTWMAVGEVLSAVASIFGLGYMLYTAVRMVRSGRGLDTYHTFWVVEFNWIGFLILFGLIPVALFVGLLFRLQERREWRSLEKKYGRRDRNV